MLCPHCGSSNNRVVNSRDAQNGMAIRRRRECMDCGDCALTDVAYVCPMSQCPKNQRNGACGGSFEGWCEVYPGKQQCVWVQAYDRLKKYNEQDKIESNVVPPPNWDFFHTSSWVNFFLGRDHAAKKLGIEPVEQKK